MLFRSVDIVIKPIDETNTRVRVDRIVADFRRNGGKGLICLAGLLEAPDGHLVTLTDSFVGYVMPSKIYACIESKRPIIFCGSAESDVDLLAREAVPRGDYWRVSCGDPAGFASALEALADRAGE